MSQTFTRRSAPLHAFASKCVRLNSVTQSHRATSVRTQWRTGDRQASSRRSGPTRCDPRASRPHCRASYAVTRERESHSEDACLTGAATRDNNNAADDVRVVDVHVHVVRRRKELPVRRVRDRPHGLGPVYQTGALVSVHHRSQSQTEHRPAVEHISHLTFVLVHERASLDVVDADKTVKAAARDVFAIRRLRDAVRQTTTPITHDTSDGRRT